MDGTWGGGSDEEHPRVSVEEQCCLVFLGHEVWFWIRNIKCGVGSSKGS